MVIYDDKGYEQSSNLPNENFQADNPSVLYVVDETTPEGEALARKVMQLYPYYDFVTDAAGELVDVVDTKIMASIDLPVATVNQVIMVTANIPAGSPDSTISFQVGDGPVEDMPIANDQAVKYYAFSSPGEYVITVSSINHGSASVEVTVNG